MTTSDNQKNNTNKNMSSIDLGDCEDKLKQIYRIDPSLPLIIYKIDYFAPDSLIPIIVYEIYHPINKSKLDLKYCEEILVKLNIPVNIDESNLFKYDPNSDFYNDNCFTYTTENGTDIILNDRKQEFSDNKLSLCENNCNYTGYNKDDKQSSCDCSIKNEMDSISDIIDSSEQSSNNFNSEKSSSGSSNIISIKCTKTLFSKDGLKYNIASYILMVFVFQFLLSILFFKKSGYPYLCNQINNIIREKGIIKNQIQTNSKYTMRQNKSYKFKRKIKFNFPPKRLFNLNFVNNMNLLKKYNKNNKKPISKFSLGNVLNKNNNMIRKVNRDNKAKNSTNNYSKNKNSKFLSTMAKFNKKFKISYNDYELNSFDYKKAKFNDKRTCCQYYLSLIKVKNIIIFSFCLKDYNSKIIKLCILSLSFSIYYAINFAFFNDKIMHDIYEAGGKYNIMYFLPKISISFATSYFITNIIKTIFLSEQNIVQVRKQISVLGANNISYKVKKTLIIKYVIFFILGFIFLGFFWVFLSSFGAVFRNTQIFIFKNVLISFSMSLIFPFFFNVFPCLFRICSLRSKNCGCIYKMSKFLQWL